MRGTTATLPAWRMASGCARQQGCTERIGPAAPDKDVPELNNNNRGNNNRRRGRGPNRPQNGGQQVNRIDSRARGNAPQLLEKYRKLAQDAHLNGDRVQAEYYLQFADHYFRVIADTRVRQEEQRQRHANGGNGGVAGDRWQDAEGEDDGTDFGIDTDFPSFDRPHVNRREDRDERQREDRPRDERQRDERPREDRQREDRQREDRQREPRQQRDERPREQRQAAFEPTSTPLPGEGIRADEGEPIVDASDNPFIRDTRAGRGLRPRGDRRSRREDSAVVAGGLDPASLPPSIGVRAEPETDGIAEAPQPAPVAPEPAPSAPVEPVAAAPASAEAEAAPAPRKRGRPRKTPLPEAAPATGE